MSEKEIKTEKTTVGHLTHDDRNMNLGSAKGKKILDQSFKKLGAGRSILIDKANRIIGGNKSVESFKAAGGKNVIIVDADRDTLIAVRRKDVDLDSKEGRELALADNQSQAVNYVPDEDMIAVVAEELKIDLVEFGIPEDDRQSETVSFSAKKNYTIKITFPTKGMLKKAEREINKLIREKYFDAVVAVKI